MNLLLAPLNRTLFSFHCLLCRSAGVTTKPLSIHYKFALNKSRSLYCNAYNPFDGVVFHFCQNQTQSLHLGNPLHKKAKLSRKAKSKEESEPSLDDLSDMVNSVELSHQVNSIADDLKNKFATELVLRPSATFFEEMPVSTGDDEEAELRMIAQIRMSSTEVTIEPVDSEDVDRIMSALQLHYPQSSASIDGSKLPPVIYIKLMRVTKEYRESLCKMAKVRTASAKEQVDELFKTSLRMCNKLRNDGEIDFDDFQLANSALLSWKRFHDGKLDKILKEKTIEIMNES